MTQEDYTHPMVPPPELLKQWEDDWHEEREHADVLLVNAYAAGALAGADAELEACLEWLEAPELNVDTYKLRAARRPKPPSLKEEAVAALEEAGRKLPIEFSNQYGIIRRALEQLPDND